MADTPSDELVNKTIAAISAISNVPSANAKNLGRPPARVIQEVFTAISKATGFPDPKIILEQEIPKEQKQERINYIQMIIEVTSKYINQPIPCEAKNITAGKDVTATLLFLIKLCEAGRLFQASKGAVVESESIPIEQEKPKEEPKQQKEEPKPHKEEPKAPKEEPKPVVKEPPKEEPKQKAPEPKPEEPKQRKAEPVPEEPPKRQKPLVPAQPLEDDRIRAEQQRQQEENERIQQLKAQNLAQPKAEKSTYQPPKSVSQRTRGEQPQEAAFKVQLKPDSESEENEQVMEIAEALDLKDEKMKNLFDGAGADQEVAGAFLKEAQEAAGDFGRGLTQNSAERQVVASKKQANQVNSKLITQVQEAVRQVIPLSKATSFLEEHLVRMRQELAMASDDCAVQEQLRQRHLNNENKSRSVADAKLRAVMEQLIASRTALSELAGAII